MQFFFKKITVLTIFSKERGCASTSKVIWISSLDTSSTIQTWSWGARVSYL